MWEDVLSIVDDETGNDEARLFVQDDNWDGSQYLRYCIWSLSLFLSCLLYYFCVLFCAVLATSWQNTVKVQPPYTSVTVSCPRSPERRLCRLAYISCRC